MRGVLLVVLVIASTAIAVGVWWYLRSAPTGRVPQEWQTGTVPPPPGPPAPEGVTTQSFGQSFKLPSGHSLRLLDFQIPLKPEIEGGESLVAAAAEVEVCAGPTRAEAMTLAAAFHLGYPNRSGEFELRPGTSGLVARKPALATSLRGEPIEAGECRKGWVTFSLGSRDDVDDRRPSSIIFDNTAFAFVPETERAHYAWTLD